MPQERRRLVLRRRFVPGDDFGELWQADYVTVIVNVLDMRSSLLVPVFPVGIDRYWEET